MGVALKVRKGRVVERRDDGTGVIEIPVAVPALVDLAKTAGGGKGEMEISDETLAELAANFVKRPGPKPMYAGHIPASARRTTPAWGFAEAAWVEDGALWNRVDLGPEAFDAIVTKRGYRSASVEIDPNFEAPTATVKGWSQGGLAITNTPALDVEFMFSAAGTADAPERTVCLSTGVLWTLEEPHMTLEQLQAAHAALETKHKEQEKRAADAEAKATQLETKLADAAKKAAESEGITAALEAQKAETAKLAGAMLARDVREALTSGVSEGKLTAAQLGGPQWQDDPTAAMAKLGFAGIDGLRAFLSNAPVVTKIGGAVASGGRAPETDPVVALTAAANKIAGEKNITFTAALEVVKAEQPHVYAAGTARYSQEG